MTIYHSSIYRIFIACCSCINGKEDSLFFVLFLYQIGELTITLKRRPILSSSFDHYWDSKLHFAGPSRLVLCELRSFGDIC